MAKEEEKDKALEEKAEVSPENIEKVSLTSKTKKIFSFLKPVYEIVDNTTQDLPIISKISNKLQPKQKKIFFSSLLAVFIILLVVLFIFLFMPNKDKELIDEDPTLKNIVTNAGGNTQDSANAEGVGVGLGVNDILPPVPLLSTRLTILDDKKLEGLMQKANILYRSGDKEEALTILKSLANFSKSIANYNLGLISFRSNELNKSILYYDKAIRSGEDVSISALNAASVAHFMGDPGKFKYYANIANAYMSKLDRNPPYSYAYALNSYYQGFYFEALSPLLHPNSNIFEDERKRLLSKMYTLFNDNAQAFEALKDVSKPEDDLALGQLLARDGRLSEARSFIQRYLDKHPQDPQALITMELISLKDGEFRSASSFLNEFSSLHEKNPNIKNPYPIKVRISPLVLDSDFAQEHIWEYTFAKSSSISNEILFYYAPFKVLDLQQALNVLSDGILDSKINSNLEESRSLLMKGVTISDINLNIAESLRLIGNNDLRGALEKINKFLDENPSYSILYYNAGLLYAQIGDLLKAHKYFLKAYHLDSTDLLSGIFAMLSGRMIFKDISAISDSVAQSIFDSKYSQEDLNFYIMLKQWINNPANAYFIAKKGARPIEHALQAIVSFKLGRLPDVASALRALKMYNPNDIVTDIFIELAKNYGKDAKYMSLNLQALFRDPNRDLNKVFYGPALAKNLYSYFGFVTGNLESQKAILNSKLSTQVKNPNGILQTLALLNFYNGDFEVSYSIYDQLINKLGEDDSNTIYQGALSAIGAGHNNNASLLLQLSKMNTPTAYESRFALGLLYQEAGNYNAAAQHFNSISNFPFKSRFLDFIIDETKIALPK